MGGDGRGTKPTIPTDATMYAQLRVHSTSTLLNGVWGGIALAKAWHSVAEHQKMLRDAARGLRLFLFKFLRRRLDPYTNGRSNAESAAYLSG